MHKKKNPHVIAGCLAAAAMLLAATAQASIVLNGGFETGDFTGWTEFGDTSNSGVDVTAPRSGTYGAYFGPIGAAGGISQNLTTNPGSAYNVTFWLQNEAGVDADTPNSFDFSWNGASVVNLVNAAAFGYTGYSFLLDASAALTELRFTFAHDPAFWDLDDVSVVEQRRPVPEPEALALMLSGIAAGYAGARRRRHEST